MTRNTGIKWEKLEETIIIRVYGVRALPPLPFLYILSMNYSVSKIILRRFSVTHLFQTFELAASRSRLYRSYMIGCVWCLFCVWFLCWLWMENSSSPGVREAANGRRPVNAPNFFQEKAISLLFRCGRSNICLYSFYQNSVWQKRLMCSSSGRVVLVSEIFPRCALAVKCFLDNFNEPRIIN